MLFAILLHEVLGHIGSGETRSNAENLDPILSISPCNGFGEVHQPGFGYSVSKIFQALTLKSSPGGNIDNPAALPFAKMFNCLDSFSLFGVHLSWTSMVAINTPSGSRKAM